MKILSTNSTGSDGFGGIHTRKLQHMKYSPEHNFYLIELNNEKRYVAHGQENQSILRLNTSDLVGGDGNINTILKTSKNLTEFNQNVEAVVSEYSNAIQTIKPDIILIPGSSLTSFFLYKAARREGYLKRTTRGRQATEIAYKHFGKHPGQLPPSLF